MYLSTFHGLRLSSFAVCQGSILFLFRCSSEFLLSGYDKNVPSTYVRGVRRHRWNESILGVGPGKGSGSKRPDRFKRVVSEIKIFNCIFKIVPFIFLFPELICFAVSSSLDRAYSWRSDQVSVEIRTVLRLCVKALLWCLLSNVTAKGFLLRSAIFFLKKNCIIFFKKNVIS